MPVSLNDSSSAAQASEDRANHTNKKDAKLLFSDKDLGIMGFHTVLNLNFSLDNSEMTKKLWCVYVCEGVCV